MTQDQTLTSNAHNPVLEQLIENGIECLDKAENTSEDWLYDLYIADARKEFRSAVEIAPDEPWLWFQIGWLELIDSDEIDDPEPIRAALQRAIDLDPDLVAAHVALAYVEANIAKARYFDSEDSGYLDFILEEFDTVELLEQRIAENDEPEIVDAFRAQIDQLRTDLKRAKDLRQRIEQAIWTGPSGEHLRAAMGRNWGDLFDARDVTIPGTDIVIEYYPCVIKNLRVIDMLDEMGEYLPTNERANFYHLIGMGFCNGNIRPAGATWLEYDIKWFEKAAKWADEMTDHEDLFLLYTHLASAILETKYPDYLAALKSSLKSYSHLVQLDDRDRWFNYWFLSLPPDDWKPGDKWPVVQQLVEAVLDQGPFEHLRDSGDRTPAEVAAWGAKMALRKGDKGLALRYLLRAREIDPDYSAVAALLAEIYIDESDLARALEEYRRVIAVDPAHPQAKRLIPILELAQEGSLNTRARDLILQVLPELRAGQELILNELSLQRGLMEQMADAQRIALREVERSRNEVRAERTYDDLLDQLHRLVQEGSRIQPAAWRAARARVAEELGPKVFNGLREEDSRHFLLTAEVFLAASRDVAAMDAAPIAVEYAKVVETELQKRFLAALEDYLEGRANARDRIRYGSRFIERNRDGSWQGSLGRLGLGEMSYLLDSIANGENDSVLGAYLRSCGIQAALLRSVSDDLRKISKKYRNGAAHTKSLTRKDLLEFRALLFDRNNGLLKRLVELGQRVDAGTHAG